MRLIDADALIEFCAERWIPLNIDAVNMQPTIEPLEILPSAQPDSCEGCKHLGKWEFEVEYGYSSPCTLCKRRVGDYYER